MQADSASLAPKTAARTNPDPSLEIREFGPGDARGWDTYVWRHPLASPFHLTAWKRTLEETFGYRPFYLMAFSGNRVVGVLPLFLLHNCIIGRALISTPMAAYGGVLAESEEVRSALGAALRIAADRFRVGCVELRNASPEQALGFAPVHRHVLYAGAIDCPEEELLNRIPRKTRRVVRKALAEPFTTRIQTEEYAVFEDLYSRNLRRLGTPAFPRNYYAALLRNFRGQIDIREVWWRTTPVAAVLSLYFRDRVMPYYGASDPAYNPQAPTTFMYYELMRWGGANGFRVFDFGRSKIDSGSGQFKEHWGFPASPMACEMLVGNGRDLPNHTPANPRYRLAIQLWRRLPLPLTRLLGPPVVKRLPP